MNRHNIIPNTPKTYNDEQSTLNSNAKSIPQSATGILPSSLCFNTKFIWKEVETSIHKVVSYLKDNKIGQELSEVVYATQNHIHNQVHEFTNSEKLNMIMLILDKALKENKSEELNTFFIEFYRLSALFLFSVDERNRAIELVEKLVNKINHSFKNKEEMEIDINLLIERDKLLLNKAQMLFWEECYEESLQIIYSKIAYFQKETTDEIYCLKMMNFIISVLNYQGWIYAMKLELEEAEKSFLLANQMIKDGKKLLQDNIQAPDYRELYKRKVKTFHQYLAFINTNTLVMKDKIDKRDRVTMHYLETSHRLVLEIIKVMTKDTFEFDEDIHRSHLILYYMQAALLSLSVSYKIEDENSQDDQDSGEKIDLERTLMFLTNANVDNSSQDMNSKIKFRQILINCIFKIVKVVLSHGKIVNKFEISSHIDFVEGKLRELILNFDESVTTSGSKDANFTLAIKNTEIYINSNAIKNFALFNVNRFTFDKMNSPVRSEINEIFVTEYICNKILYVLAKIMQDSNEVIKNFDQNLIVLESMTGYLMLNIDSMILLTKNSLYAEYKSLKSEENISEFHEQYLNSKILSDLKLERSDTFYHFYHKHHFDVRKESHLDIYNQLLSLNCFYSLELYKPCISILNFLLKEFEKMKGYFSGNNENKQTQGYLDLYIFLVFFIVKIYMKLADYFMALKYLLEICEYKYDFPHFIFNILFGVCLTKLKYSDLGAVYLDLAWKHIQLSLEEDANIKINNDISGTNFHTNVDISKVSESKIIKIIFS